MIRLTHVRTTQAIPIGFRGAKRIQRTEELIAAFQAEAFDFQSTFWKPAKQQLKKESAGKCAYCEAPTSVVAHGDVEHFRPKAVYWWLAYCYENYTYACQICNQTFKGDRFPVEGPAMQAGDLTMAAELTRPEDVAFIRKYASGVICVPMTTERLQELDLPQMVSRNEARLGTAFTVSVDAREGVTTGISAADRARTIRVLADPNTKAHDLVKPGHIFPLQARDGGVLVRAGQTEAAVDLCRLAGLSAVGVIMTGMAEDGAEGLGAIKAAGGLTIAQSEDTCVVSGMPRAAIQKGHASKIIPLDGIGSFLVNQYGGGDRTSSEKLEKGDRQEKVQKNDRNERITATKKSGLSSSR